MRLMLVATIAIMSCASPAWSQQVSSPPTPEAQAVAAKLLQEINANIQCNANAITGRQEIEKLQLELKALKAKYEPEKKDAK